MKAIVYTQYGTPDVLHLKEVAKPAPKDNEVLIKIRATPINYGDLIARNFGNVSAREFNMPSFLAELRGSFGLRKKRIRMGSELPGH